MQWHMRRHEEIHALRLVITHVKIPVKIIG